MNSITDGHLQFSTSVSSLLFETFYFLKLHSKRVNFRFFFSALDQKDVVNVNIFQEISPPSQVVSEKLDTHSCSAHLTSRDEQTSNLALDLSKLYWYGFAKSFTWICQSGKNLLLAKLSQGSLIPTGSQLKYLAGTSKPAILYLVQNIDAC